MPYASEDGTGTVPSNDFDVLIAGAGPTGLLTACELLRRDVRVRVIDRLPERSPFAKAAAVWPRAYDILTDSGIAEALHETAGDINVVSYFSGGKPLINFTIPDDLRPHHLPQYETERLLTERLEELGGKVERGVRLRDFDGADHSAGIDTGDGVTVVLEHPDSTVERFRVPYVVGADGAASTVRGLLGVGFEGSTYELAFALIDSRIEGDLPRDEILYYQSPTGTLMIAPLPDGVFRFLAVMPQEGQDVSVPMMQKLLDERGPGGVRITEPVWETVFRVHARTAAEYQRGRIFLAGDAAHIHSPAGGQGMNNALQDSYNLGWKLAAVIRGESPVTLLETYTPERAEATARIVALSDRQTKAWMAQSKVQVVLRDAAFRLAGRTGALARYILPMLAGRRVYYSPVRTTQSPSRNARCGPTRRGPGRLRIGMVFPRQVAESYGLAGPSVGIPGWTVAVVPSAGSEGLTERVERAVSRWPQVRTVAVRHSDAEPATGCSRGGYFLLRPDGHIAAHGHEEDIRHLVTELGLVLHPSMA